MVLDQLNHALRAHGLFFPPEVSTSSRATIGGMIGTDASGQGSRVWGKTSDYIEELGLVLIDRNDFTARRITATAFDRILQQPELPARIHAQVKRSVVENRERIDRIFPRVNRGSTGYNLEKVFDDDGTFDLARLIAGSEGPSRSRSASS